MIDCTKTNLTRGSKGETVKEIQTILKNKGYYHGLIDGDYGDMTVDAVKKYQKSTSNLLVDGIVGPVTCKHLTSTETPTNILTTASQVAGKKVMRAEIERIAKTYRQHIHNNKNYPDYLTTTTADNTTIKLGKTLYMGLFEQVSIFNIRNNRMPNYVELGSTANNPLVIDYQNTGYNCGPASLSMCLQMLGMWIPEQQLAKECNTTRNGTSPSSLIQIAKQHGFTMQEIPRNYTSVDKAIREGSPVFMHINTAYSGGKSCLGYINEYGHYIMCYNTKNNNYYIADPTKSFKTCKSTSIDNARSSSNMKYYRINP